MENLILKKELKFDDNIYNTIRKNIKHYRKERKITSAKLAELVGLSHDFIRQIESEKSAYNFSIDEEYKILIGNTINYIDILLFNYIYNCFIVVELKVTESRKDYFGQVMIYKNYIDKHLKSINQDKTIGIIVCRKDDKYLIEYSSDDRIRITTYVLV